MPLLSTPQVLCVRLRCRSSDVETGNALGLIDMVCPLEVTGCEISHTSDSVVIKRALRRSVSEASANEWIALVGDLASLTLALRRWPIRSWLLNG